MIASLSGLAIDGCGQIFIEKHIYTNNSSKREMNCKKYYRFTIACGINCEYMV